MSNVHPYTIFATIPHKSTAKDILIMSYDLSKRLVIGLASSALFDLSESDNIFRMEGAETYRQYQREKQNHPLKKALSFHLLKNFCQSMNKPKRPNDWVYSFIQKQSRYRLRVITIGLILHDFHSIKAENRTNTETLSIDL